MVARGGAPPQPAGPHSPTRCPLTRTRDARVKAETEKLQSLKRKHYGFIYINR